MAAAGEEVEAAAAVEEDVDGASFAATPPSLLPIAAIFWQWSQMWKLVLMSAASEIQSLLDTLRASRTNFFLFDDRISLKESDFSLRQKKSSAAVTSNFTLSLSLSLPRPNFLSQPPESSASRAACSSPPLSVSALAAAALENPISVSRATFAPEAALAASLVA